MELKSPVDVPAVDPDYRAARNPWSPTMAELNKHSNSNNWIHSYSLSYWLMVYGNGNICLGLFPRLMLILTNKVSSASCSPFHASEAA
jgi:hypothetical protein